jgi:hypothetical protein
MVVQMVLVPLVHPEEPHEESLTPMTAPSDAPL